MSQSYIPAEDAMALAWMTGFSSGITANPGIYMLAAADASAIAAAVAAFNTAFYAAENQATRTPAAVSLKDQTRNSAEQICRQYVMLIKVNPAISDQDKINIGVRPENTSRDPITCPQSSPLVNVLGSTPGLQTVVYADTNTPDSKAKPFGAMQLQLFVAVADEPTVDATDALYYGSFTRNPVPVLFTDEQDGKVATYFARWVGRRGDHGQWSQPVSMRIAA